jgi:hypothetical protein
MPSLFFKDLPLHLKALVLSLQPFDLFLIRRQIAIATEGSAILRFMMFFYPPAQHLLINVEALGRISSGVALIQDQAHRIQFEFFRILLSSCHCFYATYT